MLKGRKPELRAVKQQRGTLRPYRDIHGLAEAPAGEVVRPDGLRLEAQVIWDEFAPVAAGMGTLRPADALAFGMWCVMSSQVQAAWQTTEVVPASFVAQWRMLGELFGLAGEKSRIVMKVIDAERPTNIFSRNGRRS